MKKYIITIFIACNALSIHGSEKQQPCQGGRPSSRERVYLVTKPDSHEPHKPESPADRETPPFWFAKNQPKK